MRSMLNVLSAYTLSTPISNLLFEKKPIFFTFFRYSCYKRSRTFTYSVYRKKTSKGVFTHINSFTPFSYKISLKCLIHYVFEIFLNKINKIKNILQKKMYPIDNQIKTFLKIQYFAISNENTINNNKSIF